LLNHRNLSFFFCYNKEKVGGIMLKKIKNIALFKGLDSAVLEALINKNQISIHSYAKDATVHERDALCSGMDLVLSGELVSYYLAPNGSETMIFDFEKDSLIGANLLFSEKQKYPMNIYCREECRLLHIKKEGVSDLLKEYSFVLKFIKSMSFNAQGMNQKISIYTQKNLRENIKDYLLNLQKSQKTNTVILPVSKKQLADYFGVQRPSLFRELKTMKDISLAFQLEL